ncbi:MAG TPA: potassium transporter TrkG, partial [Bdellovibrionota bacterium]|nr:potassium transporter TrkG [Bdellovibrionota bacterium]
MKRPIGDLPKKYWAIAAGAAAYLADLIHPTWITALPVLALMGYALFRQFRSPVQYVTGDRYTRITRLALLSIAFLFFLARAWAFGRDFQSKEAIIGLGKTPGAYAFDLIFLATLTLSWLLGRLTARAFLFFKTIWRRPAAVLSGSFALLIAIGAMLLMLPVSLQRIEDVSFVNALFTATSAVCVTGLTVADISTTYSVFGQVVILAAIQFGAIGIMTVAAMAFFLSKEGSLVPEQRLLTVLGANSLRDLHRTVWTIAIVTLVLETVGAAALYFLLSGDARLRGDSAIFVSIFHSISAFANAGFSLFPDNLESFRRDAAVQTVILLLVSAGGLGFPVLWALLGKWTRVKWRIVHEIRLLLGARVALKASVLLVIFGAAAFSALESSGAFLSLDAPERMLAALFTSVTSRTAGFHSVPISAMQPASLMVLMLLMFIGGSPGGTAGG